MNWNAFRRRYPQTASVLPSDFYSAAEPDNVLRRAIKRDRTRFLDIVESLVTKTPANDIAQGSYQNGLYRKDSFVGFYSELRAYVLADQFCDPIPADIVGGDGLPDLACENLGRRGVDLEVTRFSSWDKTIDVQEAVVDKFNDTPYTPIVNYLDPFFVMPYGFHEIRANEIFVKNILYKIRQVDPQNPPSVIRNYGIEIELHRTGAARGMMGTTSVRAFPLDPEGAVNHRLREKAEKQRGYRPLILILDSNLTFLDFRDVQEVVLGTSVASIGGTEPAPQVKRSRSLWQSYMRENGVLKIPEGKVGSFSKSQFSRVAGVLYIDISGECSYIPNCYSNDIEFKDIYQKVSQTVQGLDFGTIV